MGAHVLKYPDRKVLRPLADRAAGARPVATFTCKGYHA